MMVAIPELDGATAPMVFGGRRRNALRSGAERDLRPHPERIERLAERVERLVRLRRTERAERKVAIVLFNFPPNGGATGTAAFLGVYESLFNTLNGDEGRRLRASSCRPPSTRCANASCTATRSASEPAPMSSRASRSTIMSGARRTSPRSRRSGARRPAATRPTAPRSSCSAPLRQCARRRAAGDGLRGRPDAAAVRARLRADSRFFRLLSLPARRLRRRRRAAFRHARLARIHAGQAGRHVRRLLAGAADRRAAEHLSLRRQQPVRRRARQAPLGGDAGQLSHPEPRAGRTLPRAAGPQGVARALSRDATRSARRANAASPS